MAENIVQQDDTTLQILNIEGKYVTFEMTTGRGAVKRTFTVGTNDILRITCYDNWFIAQVSLENMYEREKWQRSQSSDSPEKQESEKTPPQDS